MTSMVSGKGFRKSTALHVAQGAAGISNQNIVKIIEGILWVPDNEPNVGYSIRLKGYWRYLPST